MSNSPARGEMSLRYLILTACCCCLASATILAQTAERRPVSRATRAGAKLAPAIDPRLQQVLQVLASQHRLQTLTQLDREAALLSSKHSRRILKVARGSSDKPPGTESARQLRELAAKAGAAERKLYLALKEERVHLERELNTDEAVSLIRALNVAAIEVARIIRLRTGSLETEIPGLSRTALCRGDIVLDRVLYRYARAVTAEDESEVTAALRALQIQLACLSTRQIRVFDSALVEAVNWTETTLPAVTNRKRLSAMRDAYRQMFAPIIFAAADSSRLFPRYERPSTTWLLTHKEMLTAAARGEKTITYRVGLLIANRFSGKLKRVRGVCESGAGKNFNDGRGGRTCNALGAFFQSVMLPCDTTQWVPEKQNGATKFSCDPSCSGFPGSGKSSLLSTGQRGRFNLGGLSSSAEPTLCSYSGPHTGGGAGGIGGGSDPAGGGPSGGGMPGAPSSGSGACDVPPMFGVIGFTSPSQAYNNAFNACVQQLAGGRRQQGANVGAEASGFAPGGGKECMIARGDSQPPPTPESTTAPESTPQSESDPDKNLREAKEQVNAVIGSVVQFINELVGSEFIPEDALDQAMTAINNATLADEPMKRDGNSLMGFTTADGKTILIDPGVCTSSVNCYYTLLHEGLHSALSLSNFHGEGVQHDLIGTDFNDSLRFYADYLTYMKDELKGKGPGLCLQDNPSCTSGCSSREAAMPDCISAGLKAYSQRLREIGQDAKDCATDACWNPADQSLTSGQTCGTPNPCPGQSVALCLEGQPDCMCRNSNSGIDFKAVVRSRMWREYCERAFDDRCSSPTAPDDFGSAGNASPGTGPVGPRPVNVFKFGNLTVHSDGRVKLSSFTGTAINDPECASDSCRASQRGDW